ncbi:DEAD/DEAH box helicase [Clostridium subterminale]|uniref:DEAD/DEAH box helicase n=1 Tax=Clostridium subterminale TaxID=1550 RepID=A0ABP3VS42_CLOSU
MKNFLELNINAEIIKALEKLKITKPTPIQELSIPKISANIDVIMQSETGSGKTLAYLLPLIERINYEKRENQFIVLVPTHELALQVNEVLNTLADKSALDIKSTVIMGDVNIKRQVEKLKDKPQFVIGSPGRILELIKMKKISAHTVKTIVIDECDKLLDKNNLNMVKDVIKTTLRDRQLVMTSATLTEEALNIGESLMKSHEMIKCNNDTTINPNINNFYIVCDRRDKILILRKLMASIKPKKAITFINKSEEIEILTSKLKYHGLNVDGIHGSFVKNQRQKTMLDFKAERINLLVSSDLSARGLDIEDVTHIFNVDLPEDMNTYVHRSGRTARGDKSGTVISIISPKEIAQLKSYSTKLNFNLTEKTISHGNIEDVAAVVKNYKKSNASSAKTSKTSKKSSKPRKNIVNKDKRDKR